MKNKALLNDSVSPAESRRAEIAHDLAGARGSYPDRSRPLSTRSVTATMALLVGLTTLALIGCVPRADNRHTPEPEPPPMDFVLVSDLLRFYLDGDMEMDRGIADCYDGLCVNTDGERIVIGLPRFYVFAGHHDESISAREDTIEDRNGILIGDVSFGEKELPDIPGVVADQTLTGYGGWGEFHGFDALNFDFLRKDRRQRVVHATLGGWASEGNPPVPREETWTWTGGAVGVDYSDLTEDRVLVGDSALSVSLHEGLNEYLVRVDVTDLVDVATGTTYDDMRWINIPLRAGGFETFEIRGQFFGPNHEEVGGVFESQEEKIIGAFGGTREE